MSVSRCSPRISRSRSSRRIRGDRFDRHIFVSKIKHILTHPVPLLPASTSHLLVGLARSCQKINTLPPKFRRLATTILDHPNTFELCIVRESECDEYSITLRHVDADHSAFAVARIGINTLASQTVARLHAFASSNSLDRAESTSGLGSFFLVVLLFWLQKDMNASLLTLSQLEESKKFYA